MCLLHTQVIAFLAPADELSPKKAGATGDIHGPTLPRAAGACGDSQKVGADFASPLLRGHTECSLLPGGVSNLPYRAGLLSGGVFCNLPYRAGLLSEGCVSNLLSTRHVSVRSNTDITTVSPCSPHRRPWAGLLSGLQQPPL